MGRREVRDAAQHEAATRAAYDHARVHGGDPMVGVEYAKARSRLAWAKETPENRAMLPHYREHAAAHAKEFGVPTHWAHDTNFKDPTGHYIALQPISSDQFQQLKETGGWKGSTDYGANRSNSADIPPAHEIDKKGLVQEVRNKLRKKAGL